MYNEMVVLKLVQSMTQLISSPPEVFSDVIHDHFRLNGNKFYERIKSWMKLSENDASQCSGGAFSGEFDEGKFEIFIKLRKNYLLKFFIHSLPKARFSIDSRFKRILLDACFSFRRFSTKT